MNWIMKKKNGAWTSGVNLVSQVACIIILSFGYSLKYIESGKSRYFLFACIIFILCYFYDIYLSVRYVKAIQAAHPEKKVIQLQANLRNSGWKAVMKQKKEIIYKSAYKTYIVLNKVIPILLLLTLIAKYVLEYWYIGGSCCSCHLSGHRNDVYQIQHGF